MLAAKSTPPLLALASVCSRALLTVGSGVGPDVVPTDGRVRVVEVIGSVPPGPLIEERAAWVTPLVRPGGGREGLHLGDVQTEGVVADDDGLAGGGKPPAVSAPGGGGNGGRSSCRVFISGVLLSSFQPSAAAGASFLAIFVVDDGAIRPGRVQVAIRAPGRIPVVRHRTQLAAVAVPASSSQHAISRRGSASQFESAPGARCTQRACDTHQVSAERATWLPPP
jgi:hypothetical protein